MKRIFGITRVMLLVLGVFLLLSFGTNAQTLREFPPGIDWQQVETEYFRIIYDADYEMIAGEGRSARYGPVHWSREDGTLTEVDDMLKPFITIDDVKRHMDRT